MQQNNRQPDYGADLLGQVHVAVIRLDSKLDGLKDQFKEFKDLVNDHDHRIRQLEVAQISPERIKALEDRDYVAAATVWKVVGLILTVASIAVGIVGLK